VTERLTDRYQPGDSVEILLAAGSPEAFWCPGTVIGHAFPGVWVETAGFGRWFVTNSRRIRAPSNRENTPDHPEAREC
jgi:hypothetical protein